MNEMILKVIAGVISTLGFSIMFRLKPKQWIFAAIDGLVASVLYFVFTDVFGGDFLPNALAAFAVAILAEIFARVAKAPTTVFLYPGCIVLVPGGTLYYAMSNLLSENYDLAFQNFLTTLTVGVSIGGGIIAASLLRYILSSVISKIPKKEKSN